MFLAYAQPRILLGFAECVDSDAAQHTLGTWILWPAQTEEEGEE